MSMIAVSAIIGLSDADFQIPNLRGEQPSLGLTVAGQSAYPSEFLNENQREVTQFGILSLQHSNGPLTVQTSFIARNSTLGFTPDPIGDLLYIGLSQNAYKQDVAYGLQSDGAYTLNDTHTLRAGRVLPVRSPAQQHRLGGAADRSHHGLPRNDVPVSIVQDSADSQMIESAYVQGRVASVPALTMNYGLRFDHYAAFSSGSQASPRVNFVWATAHRHHRACGLLAVLLPAALRTGGQRVLAQFANTTAAPGCAAG